MGSDKPAALDDVVIRMKHYEDARHRHREAAAKLDLAARVAAEAATAEARAAEELQAAERKLLQIMKEVSR